MLSTRPCARPQVPEHTRNIIPVQPTSATLALTAETHLVSEQCHLLDCTLSHVSVNHIYQHKVRTHLKELRFQLTDLRSRTKQLCELTAKYRHCESTARTDLIVLHSAIAQLWATKSVAQQALIELEDAKARQLDGTKAKVRQLDGTKTEARQLDGTKAEVRQN